MAANPLSGAHILKIIGGCKLARDRILKNCVGTYVTLYWSTIQE